MSKVLLITGASRGIGAETARLAASNGYSLCLNYRSNREAAETLLDSLLQDGHKAILVQADVADEAAVMAMFETIDKTFVYPR